MSEMSPKIFVSREAVRPTQTSGELSIGKMYPVLKKKTNKKLCGRICGLKNDYSMTFAFNAERDDLFVCVVKKYFSFCFNRLF